MCAVMTSSRERLPPTLSESPPAATPDGGDSAQNGRTARDPRYERAFAALSFVMNRHFIDHLLRAMRELDMDAESLILLGLVSHLGLVRLMAPGGAGAGADAGTDAAPVRGEPQPVRLRDLTVVSRLPRETIRRKLLGLRDAGYLEQRGRGWVLIPGRIDERMRAFNYQTLRRLLATVRELEAILVQAGRRPAAFAGGLAGKAASPEGAASPEDAAGPGQGIGRQETVSQEDAADRGDAISSGPPCPARTGRRTNPAPAGRPLPGGSSR
ncbi:hypothetical protein [Castellaniella defragrans]|uniref:hypothetical protein n=1 Tax=Castellaniella defragrans TaxID=75697 RepID=UPI00130D72E2|nr:hypothetical protein [Castellaniella defragrans]